MQVTNQATNNEQISAQRLAAINQRMDRAVKRGGPDGVVPKLVAVSKTISSSGIVPVLELGQRIFGENRVQEALGKWPELKKQYQGIELHLIGPLQTNKVKDALGLFDVIQTVDREKLARVLVSEISRTGKSVTCFVQVNIGQEPQKSGVLPEDVISFVRTCEHDIGLKISGLMCIPPAKDAPGPYFALLNQLAKKLNLDLLSMGMSSDFEVGIEMGATHVRVGTALFGARNQ